MADLGRPALAPEDRHHLERVLRLRPGEDVTVCDGRGGWQACRFGPELEPAGEVSRESRPSPPVAVAFALVKGERPEWVVQKLTELGADRVVPFTAARSVVRWDAERAAHQAARLRRVAREAAGQCRRVWLPEVEEVATFDELARRPGAVLAERGGEPPWLPAGPVLVGPEGGWSDEELEQGLPRMALGPHVLRAETAAVAVGAVLAALRAGLVAPGSASRT